MIFFIKINNFKFINIYPLEYLNYPKYELNKTEKEKVSHGMGLEINAKDGVVALTHQNVLIAVAKVENNKAKMQKVFI